MTDRERHERRREVLHRELERRMKFLEEADESEFGAFGTVDWVVCWLLFFVLPLIVLGVAAL